MPVGVWQPGRHRGFEVHGEAGAPVWHELHTRDHAGAVAFYQRVFGWHTSLVSDTDEFRYTTMTEGEEQYAGIMDASAYLPEGTPSFWEVYFGVPDTDAALAAAERLGGSGAGAGGGHPVRPDGQGGRPDRRGLQDRHRLDLTGRAGAVRVLD